MNGPNPLHVGVSILTALRARRPAPSSTGAAAPAWHALGEVLARMSDEGIGALPALVGHLDEAIGEAGAHDPDRLGHGEALAFWLNLYNTGALALAACAQRANEDTVLRVRGAFTKHFVTVAGEPLSLTQVEHAKIRRFRDPRIHTALVCGSVSCPTLRFEPFTGAQLSRQLDEQARTFLAAGGAVREEKRLLLSRVFLWYGADYVRPHRMPTLLPTSRRSVARALVPWLEPSQRLIPDPRSRL